MRFGYADPPYYGCCKLYEHYHPDGLCWDDLTTHKLLIDRLVATYLDGWALSLTSTSLRTILPLCPIDVRVAAWCKSFCAFKKGVRPAYAWEPVIFWRGRNPNVGYPHLPPLKGGKQNTPKDFLIEPITLKKGLTGAKPDRFCDWILELLGFVDNDELIDLYPGTGSMGKALSAFSRCKKCDGLGYLQNMIERWDCECKRSAPQ
jgi:hypothetical protein